MTYSQKEDELVQIMASAMRNSGRTCDESTWPQVMAQEALRGLRSAGYEVVNYLHNQEYE